MPCNIFNDQWVTFRESRKLGILLSVHSFCGWSRCIKADNTNVRGMFKEHRFVCILIINFTGHLDIRPNHVHCVKKLNLAFGPCPVEKRTSANTLVSISFQSQANLYSVESYNLESKWWNWFLSELSNWLCYSFFANRKCLTKFPMIEFIPSSFMSEITRKIFQNILRQANYYKRWINIMAGWRNQMIKTHFDKMPNILQGWPTWNAQLFCTV